MDFQQRIADATRHRDQTRASYARAQEDTRRAQAEYDQAFSTAPQFSTLYEQQKNQLTNTTDIQNAKNDYTKARENVDLVRSQIDTLSESTRQMFGGTALTQAQRDAYRERQNKLLSAQFKQYDANYQAKFANYNKLVDDAFNTSMNVANKNYDSYWDKVRTKMNVWQQNIANEKQVSDAVRQAENELFRADQAYRDYQMQQRILQRKREFEQWMHNFKMQQINSRVALARQAADSEAAMEQRMRDDRLHNSQLIRNFQSNKMSWSAVEKGWRN